MTATNHALTGAIIGLSLGNPYLAIPLAFASHFALDALPHYGARGNELKLLRNRKFLNRLAIDTILDAILCGLLVFLLLTSDVAHGQLAAVCAFIAASPDLMWFQKFVDAEEGKPLPRYKNWLVKLHIEVQWFQKPIGEVVEAIWFVVSVSVILYMVKG